MSGLTISKSRRTSFSDSPLYLEVSVEEETLKKVVRHSVATAFASRVLPVPGGPTISTPCRKRMTRIKGKNAAILKYYWFTEHWNQQQNRFTSHEQMLIMKQQNKKQQKKQTARSFTKKKKTHNKSLNLINCLLQKLEQHIADIFSLLKRCKNKKCCSWPVPPPFLGASHFFDILHLSSKKVTAVSLHRSRPDITEVRREGGGTSRGRRIISEAQKTMIPGS